MAGMGGSLRSTPMAMDCLMKRRPLWEPILISLIRMATGSWMAKRSTQVPIPWIQGALPWMVETAEMEETVVMAKRMKNFRRMSFTHWLMILAQFVLKMN